MSLPCRSRLLSLALTLLLLASSASIASAADFTWSGLGSDPLGPWSASSNWVGGAAPTSGASIDTLTFPELSDIDCPMPFPTHACNTSNNDVGPVSVDHLVFGGGENYQLTGSAISLGSGGLSIGSSIVHLADGLPLSLSASQTWDVADDGILQVADLNGGSADVGISLGDFSDLFLSGESEIGNVSVTGTDAESSRLTLLGNGGTPARLNATDGHSLSLQDVELESRHAAIGSLVASGAAIDVGQRFGGAVPGTLSTSSVSLDTGSQLRMLVAGSGNTVGTNYAQLSATGNVQLGNATLVMQAKPIDPGQCQLTLPLGRVYTLVSTTGGLSGEFGNAPEGGIVSDESGCANETPNSYRINYHQSGPVQNVTATVVETRPSVPTNTALPTITGLSMVGSTLNASTGSWVGEEPIFYAFQWLRDGLPIPGATSPSYTVQAADVGHQLAVQVTASNEIGITSVNSAALSVPVVVPPPDPGDRRPSDPLPPQPPAPPRASTASVGRVRVQGSSVVLQLACSAGGGCGKVTATLSVVQQLRSGRVVAISAKKRLRTKRVVVGRASAQMGAGQSKTLRVGLNRTGKALLRRFGKLQATLRVAVGRQTAKTRGVRFS